MKRLLRVLVLAGCVFLLVHGTRTRGIAQVPTPTASCCGQGSEPEPSATACLCQNGAQFIPLACVTGADVEVAGPCNDQNGGSDQLFYYQGTDCQQNPDTSTCSNPGFSCPATYTDAAWLETAFCSVPTPTCFGNGVSCRSSSDCCGGLQCLGYGTCQPCSASAGESCTPPGASQACGTTQCDGATCLAECRSNGDCGSDEDEGKCVNGCCQYDDSGGIPGCPCSGGDQAVRRPGPTPMEDVYEPCSCDSQCEYYCDPIACTCSARDDAIVVDLSGAGFRLTSPNGGVRFDIHANGQRQQLAWPSAGWDGGFLVLDGDGKGRIDNGTKLFPQLPAQPGSGEKSRPTGFRALAAFDQPANGGNGDGQIDARDAVYAHLHVWVDSNHNGVSDPGELLSLPQLGISSISLKHERHRWTDVFGNRFSNRTGIVRNGTSQWIYTVHLNAAR